MDLDELTTLSWPELREQAEDRGMQQISGESRRDFAKRMLAYDQTMARGREVSLRGILGPRKDS